MVTPSGALAIPSKMNSMQRRRSSHYSLRENSASVFVIGDHVPGPDKYEYGAPSFRDVPPCNERRQQQMEYDEGPSPIPQTSMYAFVQLWGLRRTYEYTGTKIMTFTFIVTFSIWPFTALDAHIMRFSESTDWNLALGYLHWQKQVGLKSRFWLHCHLIFLWFRVLNEKS